MDPEQPPLTCAQCHQPIAPSAAITLAIKRGAAPGEWTSEDLAALHEDCWQDFQREHSLPGGAGPQPDEPDF